MWNRFLVILLILLPYRILGQMLLPDSVLAQQPTYTNIADAVANADKVYKLNLSKHNLNVVPQEVFKLKFLQILNLSHNQLKSLPKEIGKLQNLQLLDISRNKLTKLPDSIGQLAHLKILTLYKNDIDTLPAIMRTLCALEKLDLWENSLYFIPDELKDMKALQELDLRGILFNEKQQKHIKELFPNTKIHFSPPCTCSF